MLGSRTQKGRPLSLGVTLLLWLNFGLPDLLIGPLYLSVSCTLSWADASILILCLCTIRATYPGSVAIAQGPTPISKAFYNLGVPIIWPPRIPLGGAWVIHSTIHTHSRSRAELQPSFSSCETALGATMYTLCSSY